MIDLSRFFHSCGVLISMLVAILSKVSGYNCIKMWLIEREMAQ